MNKKKFFFFILLLLLFFYIKTNERFIEKDLSSNPPPSNPPPSNPPPSNPPLTPISELNHGISQWKPTGVINIYLPGVFKNK